MGGDASEEDQTDWRDRLRRTLRAAPSDYAGRRAALLDASHFVRAEIAAALEPALNAHLRTLPHDAYEEKRALATWVNRELHEIGLTIRCPKTGRPSILVADVRAGGDDEKGRFRIEARDENGKTARTFCSTRLPDLELMEEPPRRENFASRAVARPEARGR